MTTDSKLQLSELSYLRQELYRLIKKIVSYSEIIIKEIEDIGLDVEYLVEIEQIRACGIKLVAAIDTFLNPTVWANSQLDVPKTFNSRELRSELEILTQLVISNCQHLVDSIAANFVNDLEKIDAAANNLLQQIEQLVKTPLQIVPETSEAKTPIKENDSSSCEQYPAREGRGLCSLRQTWVSKPLENEYTILIVDDEAVNRKLLSRLILAQGYQVASAVDGKQAIAMIQTGAYDLILLDILMPEVDGYEVLQWIRTSSWQHIPTIVISALDTVDSVVRCIQMGAADYLIEPFNHTLLKARLSACLEQKRLRDRESSYLEQLARANEKIKKLNERLQVENTHLSAELEITKGLQMMLLPKEKELGQIEDLEIAAFMEPAEEVGGDYYDILQHHGRLTISIGDVTGHGLESSVLMLMVQTAVRTLAENNETDPKQFFEVLNRTIYKNLQRIDSDKNLSLCLIDYHDRVLSLSGQHEQMLLVRSGGEIERIDTIDLGFPIGLEETIQVFVFQVQVRLNRGDIVILYTDGITEAENNLGEHYGLEQLCSVVQQNWQQSADKIVEAAIADLRSHIGVEKVYDDITLVVLKQK